MLNVRIAETMNIVKTLDLPELIDENSAYHLLPNDRGFSFYQERTDRNIGWITREEQLILLKSKVAIAGCGGMGGVAAELLLRMGIGEIRIADPELFDASNIHRQIAAGVNTLGYSKAVATAKRLRSISDDVSIIVYPQGVTTETVNSFLGGVDLVLDEVEAWAIFPRILLHVEARKLGLTVVNCNSIGAGTRLLMFAPDSDTMENCIGIDLEESERFHNSMISGNLEHEERQRVGSMIMHGLLPELPEYAPTNLGFSTVKNLRDRFLDEGRAMILSGNPYGAASFMVNHAIFWLLRNSGIQREIVRPIKMPGYLYRDDLLGEIKVVSGRWY